MILLATNPFPSFALAHSAIEPVPRSDQGWKDRQESLNKRAAEAGEKAQVIFIGDSITHGWEGGGREVWTRYYAQRNAVNLGIGGDRTQHVLWRLDHGNLNGLKPKAAVVMIGTNNSNGEDNSPDQIVEGVAAIVKKLREKLPEAKVLLLAIFPRSENFSAQRGKLAMINQVLHKLADGQNVFWVDFGHEFLNLDGTIPHELMPDYLHLSPQGYEIWAEAIEDKLSSILGDARVKPASGSATGSRANLSGDWTWTMDTPNGPVSAALVLKAEGGMVTGKFARGENRWLEIQEGKVNGNEFSWTVKRDRPDGSILTYRMSGKVEGDKITGQAKTEMDGQESTSEWSAKRK
ncbi:MAG: hypothetical protein HY674_21575 [Chloroflexi bacterium]|nr:hypothetical protein [Chloroflexota bacterium]